jgi:hypothetical protein
MAIGVSRLFNSGPECSNWGPIRIGQFKLLQPQSLEMIFSRFMRLALHLGFALLALASAPAGAGEIPAGSLLPLEFHGDWCFAKDSGDDNGVVWHFTRGKCATEKGTLKVFPSMAQGGSGIFGHGLVCKFSNVFRFTNLPLRYQGYAIDMECTNDDGTCRVRPSVGIEDGKLIVWVTGDDIRMCWATFSPPPRMSPPGTFPDAEPRWRRG